MTFEKGYTPWNKGLRGLKRRPCSEEARQRMSEARKGCIPWHKGKTGCYSKEYLENQSKNKKGKHFSPATEFKKGRVLSPETEQKRRATLLKTIKTDEYRRKISLTSKGRKHTEETKKKIGEGHKGNTHTEEAKQKMSQNAAAKRPEVKKKISDALKGRPSWNKGLKDTHFSPDTEFKKGGTLPTEIEEKRVRNLTSALRTEEYKEKASMARRGEKGSGWKGGISFLPYCHKFNKRLKEMIRKRDGRTCQLCNEKENGKKLSVHHIHYDKENCEPDLIALCSKCNCKVNFNRNYYENLFIKKLKERGLLII